MRKISATILVVLFLALFANAQNSSIVTQTGDSQQATVTQTLSGTGTNTSNVTQTSSADVQTADVTQNGVGNVSTISQLSSNPASGFTNAATIQQVGDYNIGNLSSNGYGIVMGAYQTSNRNVSAQFATGGALNGSVTQNGGDGNTASQTFTSTFNDQASITQSGSSNNAIQSITGGQAGITPGNNVTAIQEGGNLNLSTQLIYGYSNTARVHETGSQNHAQQTITGNSNSAEFETEGDFNTAFMTQTGNGNSASFEAETPTTPYVVSNNMMTITQTGNNNSAYNEIGENEFVELGGVQNTLTITQSGSGNLASSATVGSHNTVTVNQLGNNNVSGTGAEAVVPDDWGISQVGDFNSASLTQTSDGNSGRIVQAGNNNSAVINQH